MQDHENADPTRLKRVPWNKGKLIGAKPPLRPKHVWSIRTKLQVEGRIRDLAMFNLAIDSKLRGCDVVALKVEDVAPSGYAVGRATTEKDRAARQVRVDGADPPSGRRLPESLRQEARRIYVHRPPRFGTEHHDETVRAARLRVDCKHRPRPSSVRYPLVTTDEGDLDLPGYRQSSRRAAPARTQKDRKHRPVPRHRGRSRPCNSGTS
jgi:hypothetical protein